MIALAHLRHDPLAQLAAGFRISLGGAHAYVTPALKVIRNQFSAVADIR
ncbi:hypothetical protein ACFY1U_34085 [Streptomyces sp. NPDC001351]